MIQYLEPGLVILRKGIALRAFEDTKLERGASWILRPAVHSVLLSNQVKNVALVYRMRVLKV
jgi:hypothetical protein